MKMQQLKNMKPPACPRCQSVYSVKFKADGGRPGKQPMLLRCGHTFCETCLQKCTRTDDAVDCPTCQIPTKVGSDTDLHKFIQPDLFTVGLLWKRRMDLELQSQKIYGAETARGRRKEGKAVAANKTGASCSECHVRTAMCQCVKCDCIMCRLCFDKIHQMSNSLKKHQPVPYSGVEEKLMLPKKTRSRNCAAHEQCQIEYFCNDDNQAICSRCVIMGDHKGHDVQTMEDKNKECLSEMEPAILAAQETVWRLEKSEKRMTAAVPSAHFDSKGIGEEIKRHFQELHSILQAREEQLLDDIQEASLSATKPIQEMKSYLQDEKLSLEMALVDAARAMNSNIHRLVDVDLVLERLRKAKDVACLLTIREDAIATPVKFSCDGSLKDTIESYGDISATSPTQMFTLSVPGPDADKPPPDELRHYSVSDLDTLSTTDTESMADSVSVIVEEEKEEEYCTEGPVAAEVVKAEPASYPPTKRLLVGHSEKVRVTHIRTPAQFYVQLMSRRNELDIMQRQINQHCRGQSGRKDLPEFVDTGSMVLAQFSHDKVWYRASITKVIEPVEESKEEGLTYEVFFIDYGNTEIVTHNKLRKVKKKFQNQAAFAYECSLYDILPVKESEGWSTESVKTMLQMTSLGPMIMQVVNTVGGVQEVDLSKPESESLSLDERPVSVRDSLVFLEMAIFNTSSSSHPAAPRMKRDFITMPRVRESTVTDIGINCVHSPSLFYVQLFSDRSHEYLHQLLVSMQEVYREETRHLYTIFCPRKDMICAARYHKDNNWYRAKVTGLPGRRRVEVQFVDYGNTETVDHSHICKIHDEHIKYPMQAIECSLADVEPMENGQWSKEAKAWFRSLVELQLCQMRVTKESKEPNRMVGVLYALNSDNRLCCINYELVSQGFAKSTGPWSQDESFLGITLAPEMQQDLSGASSPSVSPSASGSHHPGFHFPSPASSFSKKANHAAASPGSRKSRRSPKKEDSASSSSSGPKKSAARRNIAMENFQQFSETASQSPKPEGEAKPEATCTPDCGSVMVVISGYQSPAHFFIQLEEKQEELLNLMVEMAKYETAPPPDRAWKTGDFCVAKYSHDDRWYRSKIVQQTEDKMFEVNLVDFGHIDTVPADRLRSLKKAHGSVECFSQRCHLVNLLPAGSTDRAKWSNTAKEFVPSQIRGKRLFVKVEGERMPEYGLPVDILIEETIPETAFDPQKYEYVSLVNMLLDKGLAIPMKRRKSTELPSADTPASPKTDPFLTRLMPSSPSSATDEAPDVLTETKPDVNGENSSSPQDPVVVVQPDLDVVPHQPPSSTRLAVLPVYVDYEGVIYAHDLSEEEECAIQMERMDDYARKEAPDGLLQVAVGQICLSHFTTDNAWYRARVLEVCQDKVKVKYIDYGNTDTVDRSLLKLITPELCNKPQLAFELKLHNVRPNTVDGTWPITFLEYMHNKIVNFQCSAEIKGTADQHPLQVDFFTKEGQSIISELLDIGVLTKENDMEEFYERSTDITNILNHSNPFFPLRFGEKGDFIHGLVTHMDLPNLVYIQRYSANPDGTMPTDVMDFVQMMDDLNNLPPQTPALDEVPAAGEMCSAKYSQDSRWYRGLVAKACPSDMSALVFYVDYGNSEFVPLERLRVLPQRFQDTPAQALRAYLHLDLPANTTRWTYNTYMAMKESVFLRRHLVLIKHTDPLTVELFSEDTQRDGATILAYQQLINQGLVTLPNPFIVTDDDDAVVESESEVEEDTSSPTQDQFTSSPTQDQFTSSPTQDQSTSSPTQDQSQ